MFLLSEDAGSGRVGGGGGGGGGGGDVSKCSLYTFYNNPAPLNGSTQFHYCTDSNPGTGADDAFILKRGVWRNATWPSHSRPAIAASARHFQICFSPLTF